MDNVGKVAINLYDLFYGQPEDVIIAKRHALRAGLGRPWFPGSDESLGYWGYLEKNSAAPGRGKSIKHNVSTFLIGDADQKPISARSRTSDQGDWLAGSNYASIAPLAFRSPNYGNFLQGAFLTWADSRTLTKTNGSPEIPLLGWRVLSKRKPKAQCIFVSTCAGRNFNFKLRKRN